MRANRIQTGYAPVIPIHGTSNNKTVSARELHQFLGLAESQWKRWYTTTIINNPFATLGEDYWVSDITSKTGGRPTQDFEITIRFAKKISMATKNAKGNLAQEYFLRCEEIAQQVTKPQIDIIPQLVPLASSIDRVERDCQKSDTNIRKRVTKLEKEIQIHPVHPPMAFESFLEYKALTRMSPNRLLNDEELANVFGDSDVYRFGKKARMAGLKFEMKAGDHLYEVKDILKLYEEWLRSGDKQKFLK